MEHNKPKSPTVKPISESHPVSVSVSSANKTPASLSQDGTLQSSLLKSTDAQIITVHEDPLRSHYESTLAWIKECRQVSEANLHTLEAKDGR